jgi:LPXTG-motif cell wall-anchored protein
MAMTRLSRVLTAAGLGAGLLAVMAGPAAAQVDDPPGNNGTVKVDDVPFDDHPDNEPHVGCEFQIDFYGFDEGDLNADVLFEAIPPTVSSDAIPPGAGEELISDTVFIGEDAAGGGTDLDASQTYDLTDALAGIEPHPEQGWHVKLTVHAEGSIGADTKFKAFWVSGCEVPTTSSSTSSSTTSSSTTSSTTPSSSTSSTMGSTTSTVPGTAPSTPPSSAGVSPTTPATTPTGALPRTGSNTVPFLVGGLALIALGLGGVLGARHVRGARS